MAASVAYTLVTIPHDYKYIVGVMTSWLFSEQATSQQRVIQVRDAALKSSATTTRLVMRSCNNEHLFINYLKSSPNLVARKTRSKGHARIMAEPC